MGDCDGITQQTASPFSRDNVMTSDCCQYQSSWRSDTTKARRGDASGPCIYPWNHHLRVCTSRSYQASVRKLVQGREGKVVAVYRRKWVIHVERITREKVPTSNI